MTLGFNMTFSIRFSRTLLRQAKDHFALSSLFGKQIPSSSSYQQIKCSLLHQPLTQENIWLSQFKLNFVNLGCCLSKKSGLFKLRENGKTLVSRRPVTSTASRNHKTVRWYLSFRSEKRKRNKDN